MNNTKRSVENLLIAAGAASIIAMFGSLYFSEIKQYEPCALCWYQRIIMYPFTIISGIAIIRKDYWISSYTMILSAIGAFISTYHYLIQKDSFFPDHTLA
ncbi:MULTISPECIES: disulfide oxidoreductase [unclassified Bacillus (in: firmicutes)]|jgi:disulfide bond formation protein DsbB|uniref:disulfide oxidoreductase n=1 Tax=unclassified Bacillus (in: firmicutes) TaxID=185979 RepID=UPI00203510B0|nr:MULTISPECIES: disulfide oxidoreductase [unclassified Bacillus (in: firmicutes)]